MGKSKKKPKQQVTEFYMSIHFGISIVVDKLLAVIVKEKDIWNGDQSGQGVIGINRPEIFGGVTKEGGVAGSIQYLPGGPTQVMPDGLAQRLGRANGADCPGYRGVSSAFFYGTSPAGFYWGANTPFIPPVWFKVQREPIGLDPQYAMISRNLASSTVIVAYDAFWDYQEVGSTLEPSDYENIEVPEDGYDLNAQAAFGRDASGSFTPPRTINTFWPHQTSRWFRRVITINQAANLNLSGFIENGIVIWLNGEFLHEFEPNDPSTAGGVYDVDTGILPAGTHVLHVLATDEIENYGGDDNTYWDMQITQEVADELDANPAHIIYECLTNTVWGMGAPAASIDYDAFDAASQTLFAEDFGISLLWTRQAAIQDFVQEILDHIQAVLYVDPSTGLITLTLIRDDYVVASLPDLDPDNCDLTNFSRKLWGEIVNEIIVTWTNPQNEQDETITVHDDASIAMQGGVVSDSRNYYGVRTAALAQDLAFRDLRSAGQPLASCEAEVDRSQYALRPASVVKVTWPEYGITDLVMRVTTVDYGKPGDPTIKLSLIEDVYGVDIGSYDDPPTSAWVDPTAEPFAIEDVEIVTLPLFMIGLTTLEPFLDDPQYPEVVSGVLASADGGDSSTYELWDEVTLSNGSLEWQSIITNTILGRGELSALLDPEVTSTGVSFTNITGSTFPVTAGFVMIGEMGEAGNEIAMVDAVGATYTLTRGVLDTVPRRWPAGTKCWFIDDDAFFEDSILRSSGETVDYRLLSRTSKGIFPLAAATDESYTLTDRPWLPNRPANVLAYGEAFSTPTEPVDARDRPDPWVTVTWSNRNRLTEDSQVLAWDDADATPETGQTTTIEVRDQGGGLITTHDGLTGTSFDVPDASFGGQGLAELRVFSERTDADTGDTVSLQYFSHWVQIDAITFDGTAVTFDSDAITMDQL